MLNPRLGAIETEARGSLVLGGYDKSRFTEPLVSFPIESPSDVRRIGVPLTSISAVIAGASVPIWTAACDKNVNTPSVPAALDSGDMIAQIPVNAHNDLVEHLNKYRDGMLSKLKPGEPFDARIECRHSSADITSKWTKHRSKLALYESSHSQPDLQLTSPMLNQVSQSISPSSAPRQRSPSTSHSRNWCFQRLGVRAARSPFGQNQQLLISHTG